MNPTERPKNKGAISDACFRFRRSRKTVVGTFLVWRFLTNGLDFSEVRYVSAGVGPFPVELGELDFSFTALAHNAFFGCAAIAQTPGFDTFFCELVFSPKHPCSNVVLRANHRKRHQGCEKCGNIAIDHLLLHTLPPPEGISGSRKCGGKTI